MRLLKESLFVGVFISVLGLILHYLSMKYYEEHDMNKYKTLGLHLFLIGVSGHLILEYFGDWIGELNSQFWLLLSF